MGYHIGKKKIACGTTGEKKRKDMRMIYYGEFSTNEQKVDKRTLNNKGVYWKRFRGCLTFYVLVLFSSAVVLYAVYVTAEREETFRRQAAL
jgi:hypothetical protein